MPDSIKLLNVSWADFKTFQTRDSFDVYYVDGTSSIETIGVTVKWTYYVKVSGSELTDFNTNYKSAAIAVPAIDDAIAAANLREQIDVNVTSTPNVPTTKPPRTAAGMIWRYTRFNTSSSSEVTAHTYTVTTGKTFYLLYYVIHYRVTSNYFTGTARLKVAGNTRHATYYSGGSSGGDDYIAIFACQPAVPIPFADSGEAITFTIDQSTTGSHNYDVTMYGFEATPEE